MGLCLPAGQAGAALYTKSERLTGLAAAFLKKRNLLRAL